MTSKKAINLYVASLVGNNTHAYYKRSHGYVQLSHPLSNNHDLYGWSSNLRDIKSRYKFELMEVPFLLQTVCMGIRLSSSRYSLISFCHGLGLHPLSSQGMQQNVNFVANEIHLVIACLCKKGGGTLTTYMYYWMNSGNIHVYGQPMDRIHVLLHISSYALSELWLHKRFISTRLFLKVGCGMGQGPATEVTHLRLNEPQCMVV